MGQTYFSLLPNFLCGQVLHYCLLKKRLVSQPDPIYLCTWNCFLLAISTTAVSGHRKPGSLFYTFMPSYTSLWMQLLLPFCDVALKQSWDKGLLQRCKVLNSWPAVTCHSALRWCREETLRSRRECESQRTVSSPAFCFPFFLTVGSSHFASLEGSCSLFSSLQMNAPLFAARHGGLVYGCRVAWVSMTSVLIWHLQFRKLYWFIWETSLSKKKRKILVLQTEAVYPGTGILSWGVRPWLLWDDGASLNHHYKILTLQWAGSLGLETGNLGFSPAMCSLPLP